MQKADERKRKRLKTIVNKLYIFLSIPTEIDPTSSYKYTPKFTQEIHTSPPTPIRIIYYLYTHGHYRIKHTNSIRIKNKKIIAIES